MTTIKPLGSPVSINRFLSETVLNHGYFSGCEILASLDLTEVKCKDLFVVFIGNDKESIMLRLDTFEQMTFHCTGNLVTIGLYRIPVNELRIMIQLKMAAT